jgi:hypothetical protein
MLENYSPIRWVCGGCPTCGGALYRYFRDREWTCFLCGRECKLRPVEAPAR